jgi:hypothetical protein
MKTPHYYHWRVTLERDGEGHQFRATVAATSGYRAQRYARLKLADYQKKAGQQVNTTKYRMIGLERLD